MRTHCDTTGIWSTVLDNPLIFVIISGNCLYIVSAFVCRTTSGHRHKCSPLARARNICCGLKFCVRDTKTVSDFVQKHFVSATICAAQETSWATKCPRLPAPLNLLHGKVFTSTMELGSESRGKRGGGVGGKGSYYTMALSLSRQCL